jgi:hypothetical protein
MRKSKIHLEKSFFGGENKMAVKKKAVKKKVAKKKRM